MGRVVIAASPICNPTPTWAGKVEAASRRFSRWESGETPLLLYALREALLTHRIKCPSLECKNKVRSGLRVPPCCAWSNAISLEHLRQPVEKLDEPRLERILGPDDAKAVFGGEALEDFGAVSEMID